MYWYYFARRRRAKFLKKLAVFNSKNTYFECFYVTSKKNLKTENRRGSGGSSETRRRRKAPRGIPRRSPGVSRRGRKGGGSTGGTPGSSARGSRSLLPGTGSTRPRGSAAAAPGWRLWHRSGPRPQEWARPHSWWQSPPSSQTPCSQGPGWEVPGEKGYDSQ